MALFASALLHLHTGQLSQYHIVVLVEVEHVDGGHLARGAAGTGCAVKAGHLSEGAMRVFCRSSQLAASRADVRPSQHSRSLLLPAQDGPHQHALPRPGLQCDTGKVAQYEGAEVRMQIAPSMGGFCGQRASPLRVSVQLHSPTAHTGHYTIE
jgi:hypothetical protein